MTNHDDKKLRKWHFSTQTSLGEDGLVLRADRTYVQQGRFEVRRWYNLDSRLGPTKSDLNPSVDEVE